MNTNGKYIAKRVSQQNIFSTFKAFEFLAKNVNQ